MVLLIMEKKTNSYYQTPKEEAMLQSQIESTDAQIDALVYALYALTEEEIKIVEGNWGWWSLDPRGLRDPWGLV